METKLFRWGVILAILLIALAGVTVAATALGPVNIGMDKVTLIILSDAISKVPVLSGPVHITKTWTDSDADIITMVRLPRVILSLLVGATLAVAGVTAQAIFKNPMADPYILGVSSGSAFGAALVIVFGLSGLALAMPLYLVTISITSIEFGALAGGLLAALLIFGIAGTRGRVPMETVLLSGVAISSFFWAITSFLMYIAGRTLSQIVYWVMGALWISSWDYVFFLLPIALSGMVIVFAFSRDLNMLLLGDEAATHLGTSVGLLKAGMVVLMSLMTAAAVSVSGIISFVGLVIPHIMRLIVGPDHRILIPSSLLVGAMFLTAADTFSRVIVQPTEMPVGIVTAFVGAPFFIYLLLRKKKSVA